MVEYVYMEKHTHTSHCPVASVATLLSDPWTMQIIHTLLTEKELRFCELERTLVGISTRTLTAKLKTLEEKSILQKADSGYSLTPHGKKLKPVLKAMETFGRL